MGFHKKTQGSGNEDGQLAMVPAFFVSAGKWGEVKTKCEEPRDTGMEKVKARGRGL